MHAQKKGDRIKKLHMERIKKHHMENAQRNFIWKDLLWRKFFTVKNNRSNKEPPDRVFSSKNRLEFFEMVFFFFYR